MGSIKDEDKKKEYEQYVSQVTPTRNLFIQMLKAFIIGGLICVLGQGILNYCKSLGMDKETAGNWCSLTLIFLSVLFTGFNLYQKLVSFAGAGALVPITGFANTVTAAAMEYRREGYLQGMGAKMLIIASPVITYGILVSFIVALIKSLILGLL